MPSCATCGKGWPTHYVLCPDDGTTLTPDTISMDGALALAQTLTDELSPGTIAGEYRIEQKIGEGGMGTVYGARHTLIGKRAAIKVIRGDLSASKEAVDRFVLEAQAVNQIGHANIVDVFGFGQLGDGRRFFVMEWLKGESLRARLTRPITHVEALDILIDVTKALEAAHHAGVVHRDMKPDNVFLTATQDEKPIVKLLDFGLAKLSGPNETRIDRTRTGMVMGTPLYISPEQARGIRIDAAADIYSLGAIAYELFCGRVPFMYDSAVEIMSAHITQPLRPPREVIANVPPELDALIVAMMAKDPAQRPSATQVRAALVAIRTRSGVGWPIATPVATSAPTSQPRRRRHVGVIVGVAAVVLAGGGVATYLATRTSDEPVAATTIAGPATAAPRPLPPPTPVDTKPIEPAPPTPVDTKPIDPPKPIDEPTTTPKHIAEPKTAPKPKVGTVVVKLAGVPRGQIFVDGKLVARGTDATLELAAGDHELRVSAADHKPIVKGLHVSAGSRQELDLTPQANTNAVHDPFGDE